MTKKQELIQEYEEKTGKKNGKFLSEDKLIELIQEATKETTVEEPTYEDTEKIVLENVELPNPPKRTEEPKKQEEKPPILSPTKKKEEILKAYQREQEMIKLKTKGGIEISKGVIILEGKPYKIVNGKYVREKDALILEQKLNIKKAENEISKLS